MYSDDIIIRIVIPTCDRKESLLRVGILYDLGNEYFETVDVGDYQALASKVMQLSNDSLRYSTLTDKAFSWAQKSDASWTVREFSYLDGKMINASK